MATFNRSRPTLRITPSVMLLIGLLLAAFGLSFVPPAVTQSLRGAWREALLPTQRALSATGNLVNAAWKKLPTFQTAAADNSQQKIADLTDQLDRLQAQLELERSLAPAPRPGQNNETADDTPSLLIPQLIPARVLGQQAQAFLLTHDLLDVGRTQGALPNSFVIDEIPQLIDQGRDASVKPGRLVLAGSRVWGKVAEVGPHTCTVRRITDAGYRDLVQLATSREGRLHFSARGVLVGAGQRLCKIELVETTEPVAAGDLVFTADDGVLQSPLLYGKIVKLDRKPGEAHWQIWMEPAVKPSAPPARVSVLKMELNPARVAETSSNTNR